MAKLRIKQLTKHSFKVIRKTAKQGAKPKVKRKKR